MQTRPSVSDPSLQGISWVYYIRRDGLVKIGTTTRLAQRMNALRPDDILAIEPGDRVTETNRHKKFRREWLGRNHPDGTEWFRPSARLLRHTARLTRKYPVPLLDAVVILRKVTDVERGVSSKTPATSTAPLPVVRPESNVRISHGGLLPEWWPIAVVVYAILCGALYTVIGPYVLPFFSITLIILFFLHGATITRTYRTKMKKGG